MTDGPEIRRIADGETIPVGVFHDFLMAILHSHAIYDVLLERMAFFDDCHQLDPDGLAVLLPELVAGVNDVVGREDWIVVAEVADRGIPRDARGRGGATSSEWIEIDGEVLAEIKAQAEAFVDSPNDVLRRVFGLRAGDRLTCSVSPFSEHPPSPGGRLGKSDARDALPEGEYELPIAKVLAEAGGRALGREVMAVVRELLDHRFSAADRLRLQNTEERWRNRLCFCRRPMLEGVTCVRTPRAAFGS